MELVNLLHPAELGLRNHRPERPSSPSWSADKYWHRHIAHRNAGCPHNARRYIAFAAHRRRSGRTPLAKRPETSPLRQSKSVSCSQNHLPRERRGKSQVGGHDGRFSGREPRGPGFERGEYSRLERDFRILWIRQITSTPTLRLQAVLTDQITELHRIAVSFGVFCRFHSCYPVEM